MATTEFRITLTNDKVMTITKTAKGSVKNAADAARYVKNEYINNPSLAKALGYEGARVFKVETITTKTEYFVD